MKKGIIFDMDGTLWDSAQNVAKSWNMVLVEKKIDRAPITMEDMHRVMGKTMDVIAEILFPQLERDEKIELLHQCCLAENDYLREHGGILYPKVKETLARLKENYHLYIVSNCQVGYIEAFLDYYGLQDLIEDTQCYGQNELPKGDNIRILYDRNGLDAAVYVGDIEGDYEASKKAGIPFIHASYGFGTISEDVPKIRTFDELDRVVTGVLG